MINSSAGFAVVSIVKYLQNTNFSMIKQELFTVSSLYLIKS
jgi:hypothetical protein